MQATSPPPPAARAALDLGLGRIAAVLSALGSPHHAYPCVHVAGTNGKGSTCALLASCLRAGGARVGSFVSPFLREPRDAVRVGGGEGLGGPGRVVSAADWEAALAEVDAAAVASAGDGGAQLTTFERWTAAAFVAFRSANVDVAVVEVGVGGRTDATNVIPTPLVAVLTPISLDHVELLGPTLRDIARHKAGIIKGGGESALSLSAAASTLPAAVMAHSMSPDCADVIAAQASEVGARLIVAPQLVWADAGGAGSPRSPICRPTPSAPFPTAIEPATGLRIPIALQGAYQLDNAATALAALRIVQEVGFCPSPSPSPSPSPFALDNDALVRGFASVRWPGRLEWVRMRAGDGASPGVTLDYLLDGGHNEDALPRVRAAVDCAVAEGGYERVVLVYGGTASRRVDALLPLLVRDGDTVFAVPFSTPEGMPWVRSHPPEAVVAAATATGLSGGGARVTALPFPSLRAALEAVAADPVLSSPTTLRVCCGSLYLVADAYREAVGGEGEK
jgi:dihydrofolate synthase / folylpolyglutamate synthase